MGRTKIAITLDENTLSRVDQLVRERRYRNRSRAIEAAVEEKLERLECVRLVRECAKLEPAFEKALAEEGMSEELGEWPEY
jgi:metal-responsive CopG/Arc/MetJ family transcriptional regulator